MNKYHFFLFSCMTMIGSQLPAQGGYVEFQYDGYSNYDDPDGYDDSDVIWIGPGIYYGLYFAARPDYYTWRRNNLYYHRYYHYGYRRYHYHYYDRRYGHGRHYHRGRSRGYYRRGHRGGRRGHSRRGGHGGRR